jgi:hypothetical protein
MRSKLLAFVAVFFVAGGGAASAQGPYVGASIFADVVRTSNTDSGFDNHGGGGEAVGFALKVGAPIGANWGVELEFARPSVIRRTEALVFPALPVVLSPEQLAALADVAPTIFPPPIFPVPVAFETRDRHTSLSAVLWAMQTVSDRVSLVYLGGVAFNRFEREYGYAFDIAPALFSRSRTTVYGTTPLVGFESWIGLTDRLTLVPGVRLQGVHDGWTVRPAVGISWSF